MGLALSLVASVALLRSTVNEFVPKEIRSYFWSFARRFSTEITICVNETHEGCRNLLFYAIVAYLDGHVLSKSALPKRFTVGKIEMARNLKLGLDVNSEIVDKFMDVPMKWRFNSNNSDHVNSTIPFQSETRWYELRFHKMHAEMVKNKYLPHILDMAKSLKDQNKIVKFHTVSHDRWSSSKVNLHHPMTFKTLVMDGDLKEMVVKDLDRFRNGKQYYKKIGKVWKRGYLLFGPPGTGKSSLIAAMANHLNYDIYNLNLSSVSSDYVLENLLLHLPSRSILVVEDIDCSIKLPNRKSDKNNPDFNSRQVTLAGLLNAIDGLLSCCGEEKITIFTTNFKERIDPALLRPGRMDMHIHLSYCTFSTFKQLAFNYLEISDHDLFPQIEKLIGKVKVSPADVAGELMKANGLIASLEPFVKFLKSKEAEEPIPVAPSPTKVDDNRERETDNNSRPGNESEGQVYGVEMVDPPTLSSKYAIKPEFAPIIEAIFSRHGDIVANSTLHSKQFRSSLLDVICGIIQKLQLATLKDFNQTEFNSLLSEVEDLESVKVEVGWLRKRLDEISNNAVPLGDLKAVS